MTSASRTVNRLYKLYMKKYDDMYGLLKTGRAREAGEFFHKLRIPLAGIFPDDYRKVKNDVGAPEIDPICLFYDRTKAFYTCIMKGDGRHDPNTYNQLETELQMIEDNKELMYFFSSLLNYELALVVFQEFSEAQEIDPNTNIIDFLLGYLEANRLVLETYLVKPVNDECKIKLIQRCLKLFDN